MTQRSRIAQDQPTDGIAAVTAAHKVYFAAVAALALWVGVWGYFLPQGVEAAIPWPVPPLHARFLGAMYLSGAAFMIGCLLARRWDEVRVVVPMLGVWTGTLGIVSLLHLAEFDFGRSQSQVWFAAYGAFPVIAFWLAWRMRAMPAGQDGGPAQGGILPAWVNRYLRAQGLAITLLALALLLAPTAMSDLWPWPVTPLLAQLYGAPFLAYGVGSLLLARETRWPPQRIAVAATRVFAALVLLASLLHRALFSTAELADLLWFGAFLVAVLALGAIVGAGRRAMAATGTTKSAP